jgi:hypothetical protein
VAVDSWVGLAWPGLGGEKALPGRDLLSSGSTEHRPLATGHCTLGGSVNRPPPAANARPPTVLSWPSILPRYYMYCLQPCSQPTTETG